MLALVEALMRYEETTAATGWGALSPDARANWKELILDSHNMKALFLEVMRRAKAKYAFRVKNFCIMERGLLNNAPVQTP